MSIFPKIEANQQKQVEKATQERIKQIENYADSVLSLLAKNDLNLADTALVLKVAGDKLNQKGSQMKLVNIL